MQAPPQAPQPRRAPQQKKQRNGAAPPPAAPPHLHPGLVVQVGDVELAAGGVGQHLVVLLQDLVEPHVVEVDVPALTGSTGGQYSRAVHRISFDRNQWAQLAAVVQLCWPSARTVEPHAKSCRSVCMQCCVPCVFVVDLI